MAMHAPFTYGDDHLTKISFPLGGIGTGSIGLSGAGRLIDWEIFNRPSKGSTNGLSHFAIRAERDGEVLDARVLNGPYAGDLSGDFGAEAGRNFGFGARRDSLAGMPSFAECTFDGRFPAARLSFADERFPGQVSVTAFNPFIPMDERNSSMPVAMLEFAIRNTTDERIDYTLAGVLGHGPHRPTAAAPVTGGGATGYVARTTTQPGDAPAYAELAIVTDAERTSGQTYLYRGLWFEALQVYWDDFCRPGPFRDRPSVPDYTEGGMPIGRDHSLQAAHVAIEPGETRRVRYVIGWYVPNFEKHWVSQHWHFTDPVGVGATWKNWYASEWSGAEDVARDALANWDRLEADTLRFRDALYASSLPLATLDAAAANISILKTATTVRLTDGSFYAWEGLSADVGCCEGSCSHVWNYQQALPFLFPALERSMRTLDYRENLNEAGGMSFRLSLPLGTRRQTERPCADGQFGNAMKAYRDWKLSGDDAWLADLWPSIKKSIEYAWSPDNPDRWDPERTGVLWGQQHHTLDMELFGPNSWLTGFYLGALKAGAEMARHLGEEDTAAQYEEIFARGRAWVTENLFNGEYFVHRVDLTDKSTLDPYFETFLSRRLVNGNVYDVYWSEEHRQLKYQAAEACLIDQVLAQLHADIYGLGDILDPAQVKSAVRAIWRYNFIEDLGDIYNSCRVYGVAGEAGTLICAYPDPAAAPAVPVPYAQETMHGFEYSFGAMLYRHGLLDEGAAVFAAVRDRYDGARRNPWNEMEAGSNYARSMASWAALPVLSGFAFDAHRGYMRFAPRVREGGRFTGFWSNGTAWGVAELAEGRFTLRVLYGRTALECLELPFAETPAEVVATRNNQPLDCRLDGNAVLIGRLDIGAGEEVVIAHAGLSAAGLRDISTL